MRHTVRSALFIVFALALAGCSSLKREEAAARFQAEMDGFIGQSSDDLILARGVPTGTAILTNGTKVLEYAKSRTETVGGGSYTVNNPVFIPRPGGAGSWIYVPSQQNQPVQSWEVRCKLLFHVSADNKVLSWKAEGNGCY
jgi:hypothetical protein